MSGQFKLNPKLLQIPILLYSILGISYWFFFLEPGMGDEGMMALYLDEATESGLYRLLQSGKYSIPHAILVYPLSLIFPSYLSLRILSLLGTTFIFYYLCRRHAPNSVEFKLHLLFYLTSGSFLLGTNDNLLICFLLVFISESLLYFSGKSPRIPAAAWFCLVSAFFTREMAIIYLPLILGIVVYIQLTKRVGYREGLLIMGSIAFWIILNLPAIGQNGAVSFDSKNVAAQENVTWPQRQYLSQIYANQGLIPEFSHVSWEETRNYLLKNGEDSLPSTTFDSLLFDIQLTWKEFWKDWFFILKAGFRQTGLAILFPFLGWFLLGKKDSFLKLLGTGQLVQMLIFAVLIISYVEIRWLAPALLIGIIGLEKITESSEKGPVIRTLNEWMLLVLASYGIFKYVLLIKGTGTWLHWIS